MRRVRRSRRRPLLGASLLAVILIFSSASVLSFDQAFHYSSTAENASTEVSYHKEIPLLANPFSCSPATHPFIGRHCPFSNTKNTTSLRIAVVKPVFTTTAYSSFYTFYGEFSGISKGTIVHKDLNLLNAMLVNDWGESAGLYAFINSSSAKSAGLNVGNNTKILTDINVSDGGLFNKTTGLRLFDVVVLGFSEYVTASEYHAYENFVATGGRLIMLSACNFIAEVGYNHSAHKLSLIAGHGWVFNGSAAWKGSFDRWRTENSNWVGSSYRLFYTAGYSINGATLNTNNTLGLLMSGVFGKHVFSSYRPHEENVLSNSTDMIIALWQVSNLHQQNLSVAVYEHHYRDGVVIHSGVFATDIIAYDVQMQYFLLESIFFRTN